MRLTESTVTYRYENGKEQTGLIADKARIYRNMLGEDRHLYPFQSEGFFRAIGIFAAHADFQAEVPPQSQRGFEENYYTLTGVRPIPHNDGYYPIEVATSRDKWGPELRIYFPDRSDPLELPPGVEIRSGKADGLIRINSNHLWWQLVRAGFRLGKQQHADAIRATIPAQFVGDFNEGYLG
jgi:hypothetical protein